MSSTTATYGYGESSFFCNYYCSKWFRKHRMCNWLIKENEFGAVTFWVRYFFRDSILFLVLFSTFSSTFLVIFRYFLEKFFCLFCKSLLPSLTSVNCEGPYFAEGFLHNLCPCFDIVFVPLGLITRTNNKIVEIVAASKCYLITNKKKEFKK